MTCRTGEHRFLASNCEIVSTTAKGSVFTTRTASALAVDASGTATGLEENKERTKLTQVSMIAGDKGDQAKAGSLYRLGMIG
jgi:hypothetical protein